MPEKPDIEATSSITMTGEAAKRLANAEDTQLDELDDAEQGQPEPAKDEDSDPKPDDPQPDDEPAPEPDQPA